METKTTGSVCVLIPGIKQVDVTNAESFGEELQRLIIPGQRYVLNMRNMVFLDSSGLGKIIGALRKASEQKTSLVLCNLNQAVKVLFDMVRLHQIAEIFETEAEAVEHQSEMTG